MESWAQERQLLWDVITEMVKDGMVAGSSGNASMRLPGRSTDTLLVTPMGKPYRDMGPGDLLTIDMAGDPVEGEEPPSSETALHLAMYNSRPDIGAVLHTHSTYATIAAVAGTEIPPLVDEMVYRVGGSIPVAEYAFPSTEDLGWNARMAMGDGNAVLLRNHGLVGVGRTPWEAFDVCQLVERVAQVFVYSTILGRATPLPQEFVDIETELFQMKRRASSPRRRTYIQDS